MGIFSRKPKLSSYVEDGHKDLLSEAKARFHAASEADAHQRELELDDLRFCDPDGQWPDDIRSQRDAERRPCLSVDRLGPFVHQIVNEQRQNRPQPSVNPVGDGADKETAEVLQGMIRHIAYQSNGDTAIDTAFESQVRCGRGYFRVLTDYCTPDSFDQDVQIVRVPNHHSVYLDPAATEPDGADSEYAFVSSYLPSTLYRAEYPNSKMNSLDDGDWTSIGDNAPEWVQRDGSGVMVTEYFRRVRKAVTIYRLEDGSTVKELPEGVEAVDSRTSVQIEVQWFKLNAIEILDQTVWPGKHIPIVPVYGTELNVDGKRTWSGLVRSAKDAQRAFNYWKSAQAETIALAPKAPWVGPKGFMGNMRSIWQSANRRPLSVLEYESYDSQQRPLAPPQRNMIEPPIQAITGAMLGAIDDLKATTGMYDANLGNRESGQSGVAIRQLQRQGQAGSFHYADNLARSIRHLGRILIDLVPKIYDRQRVVRIIKPDESSDTVTINGPSDVKDKVTGLAKVYDLSVGTYDVTVSVGPGYQTKRQENLAILESAMQGPMGQLFTTVAPDLWASMLDFAIGPQLVERFKKALPPQFQEKPEGDQGPQIPPEMQQQMQQSGQMIEQLTQKVHELSDQVEQDTAKAQADMAKAQLDAQTKLEIARMNNETELIKVQATLDAKKADDQLNAQLADLQTEHGELQQLVLSMHDGLSQTHEAGETPKEEAAEPKHDEAKEDPIHGILQQHGAALDQIGQALHRLGKPKKTRIVADPVTGKAIGAEQYEEEEV